LKDGYEGVSLSYINFHVWRASVMPVSSNRVFPNIFKAFYDIINSRIPDPIASSRNSGSSRQWVFSSYPEADLDDNRVKLPLIVIEPADMDTEPFTVVKKKGNIDLAIRCYDTRMDRADSLLANVFSVLDDQIWTLKNYYNIHFLQLTSTDTEWYYHEGTRVHVRVAKYSCMWTYLSGLAKTSISAGTDLGSAGQIFKEGEGWIVSQGHIREIQNATTDSISAIKASYPEVIFSDGGVKQYSLQTVLSTASIEMSSLSTIDAAATIMKIAQTPIDSGSYVSKSGDVYISSDAEIV
jgi:hypothetical protein